MPKQPRFSRYRRLPPVFRFGEHKLPDPNEEEQRLTLYLTGTLLDLAEAQATRAGVETIQEYCAQLLARAIQATRTTAHVEEIEAKRGTLEGLREIADDPAYLAEWSTQAGNRDQSPPEPPETDFESGAVVDVPFYSVEMPLVLEPARDNRSAASEVVMRHAGQAGNDSQAFLNSLRRGEPARLDEVAELAQALQTLEDETRGARTIDRPLAYALHKLAFEAQVLHTDAYPGAFDEWTVETLRAVQEFVDRILSDQDIRYYPHESRPEAPR